MKTAIIHDWLTGMRGGEKCLEVFCELFPDADLFTLVHDPGSASPAIERMRIKTSFIGRLPGAKAGFRRYLPLFPLAVEGFDLRGYELVLSSSHCAAKGVIPPPASVHVCYIYTPMRYAWDMYHEYFPGGKSGLASRLLVPFFMNRLRAWDVASSARVDRFAAISRHVARRVELYYRRDSEVIYPPVDLDAYRPGGEDGGFFLMVSALVPYKRVDLAVSAFNMLGLPLVVIGAGPEEERLRSMARGNVQFLGWQDHAVLARRYASCRAFVFPGEEDFGITPLEAQASGRPVIAYGAGGALETVAGLGDAPEGEQPTGVFFREQTAECLAAAVERFIREEGAFRDREAVRRNTIRFSRPRFRDEIARFINKAVGR